MKFLKLLKNILIFSIIISFVFCTVVSAEGEDGQSTHIILNQASSTMYTSDVEVSSTRLCSLNGQDGAYWDGILWYASNDNDIYEYDPETYQQIGTVTLDRTEGSKTLIPHSNTISFYTVNGETYLYTNVYTEYIANGNTLSSRHCGECLVYRMNKDANGNYSTTLVQVLRIGFLDDTSLWPSVNSTRPYGNFVIDQNNGKLYVYVPDSESNITQWYQFDIPDPSAGSFDSSYTLTDVNVYTLEKDSWSLHWQGVYQYLPQGSAVIRGNIWTTAGAQGNPMLYITKPGQTESVAVFDLTQAGFYREPEMIAVYNGTIYYGDTYHVYKFKLSNCSCHDMIHHDEVPATCAANGTKENWRCRVCGKYFEDNLGQNQINDITLYQDSSHSFVKNSDGSYTCSICGVKSSSSIYTELIADCFIDPSSGTLFYSNMDSRTSYLIDISNEIRYTDEMKISAKNARFMITTYDENNCFVSSTGIKKLGSEISFEELRSQGNVKYIRISVIGNAVPEIYFGTIRVSTSADAS